jgi:putative chitinase
MITPAHLRTIAGSSTTHPLMVEIASAFNEHAGRFGVTNHRRIAQFLGNVCHENGGFTKLVESLNYSPEGLMATFGRHRISESEAKAYGRTKSRPANQKAIANLIYGGDWGKKNLGNINPNDGWDFRGSGIGQPTGRANFKRCEDATGIQFTDHPEKMRDVENSMIAALTLWSKWGLNELADSGQTEAIRKKWNGGLLGIKEVKEAITRGLKLNLSVSAQPEAKLAPVTAPVAQKPVPAPPPGRIVNEATGKTSPIHASGPEMDESTKATTAPPSKAKQGFLVVALGFIATFVGWVVGQVWAGLCAVPVLSELFSQCVN